MVTLERRWRESEAGNYAHVLLRRLKPSEGEVPAIDIAERFRAGLRPTDKLVVLPPTTRATRERYEAAGQRAESRATFRRAIVWCEKGRVIRSRLRDPRMIAQSEVRIAQCKLGLARLASRVGAKARLIAEAERGVAEAKRLYDRTPQEPHRLDEIRELEAAIASVRGAR